MFGRRRGRRRWGAGLLVVCATVLGSDQSGLLMTAGLTGSVASPGGADTEPAAPEPRRFSLAGRFDGLAARLRVPAETGAPLPSDRASERTTEVAGVTAIRRESAQEPPPLHFEQQERPTATAAPPAALASSRYDSSTGKPGTWAVLIGINDYPGARYDLRSAVNDVNDVNDALGRLGVTNDRRLVLRDGQASADTIRAAVDWMAARAGPDAMMVFFFAGHVQKQEAGNEAMVGADGAAVHDHELAALLDRSPANRAWISIAACYAGGFNEVVRPGRILTAAAPADRLAYQNENFGRSYLVEYMVRRAIMSKGMSTVESAFSWAAAELARDFPNRQLVQQDAVDGELDLRVPSPKPSSPSSNGGSPPPSSPPTTRPDGCSDLTIGVVRCQ